MNEKMPVPFFTGTALTTSYSYFGNTGDQRLETIQNFKSSGTINVSKFDYTYNAVGTIATWTQQADSGTAIVNTLSYDGADQLTNAVQSGGGSASNAYHYDPAGNRLAEVTGSGTTSGQFNSLNQLTALGGGTSQTVAGHTSAAVSSATVNALPAIITGGTNFSASVPLPTGTNVVSVVAQPTTTSNPIATQRVQIITTGSAATSLSYDANGNVLTDENGNTYTWDALNRLTAIVYHSGTYSGTHTEFAYDGLSRRVQIIERAGTTVGSGTVSSTKNYLWIGSEIAEERDASNSVTKRFFPQGEQQSGTDYYYTRDHEASVREMCNSSGTIVARYSYDPYGVPTLVSGTNLATFQYAGDYYHATSGFNLTWARAYDPYTGRWLSRDPILENGGINLYGYVTDDPDNLIDPWGLQGVTVTVPYHRIPPDQRTPPLPSGGYKPAPGVRLPKPVDSAGAAESAAEGVGAAPAVLDDLLQEVDWNVQYGRGRAMCLKVPHSPGRKCKCCVISMDEQHDPSGNWTVYGNGSGHVYDMPCSKTQEFRENTPKMERPGSNIVDESYEDW
jgi:RHS repeat-associated protein